MLYNDIKVLCFELATSLPRKFLAVTAYKILSKLIGSIDHMTTETCAGGSAK